MDTRPFDSEDDADRVYADYLARREMGASETLADLCDAHPQLASALRRKEIECAALSALWRGTSSPEPAAVAMSAVELSAAAHEIERLQRNRVERKRHRPLGEVARGGMGAIWRVWDDDLRRTLAMKVLRGADGERSPIVRPRALGRFLSEARITGQLDHPGIVPVHELGVDDDGRVYFTMKLVKGRDLRRVYELVRDGAEGWNVTRALGVLLRVCDAMSFAHARGVVHRDLKPANVMVGDFGEVYVMDWGVARVLRHDDFSGEEESAAPPDIGLTTREGTVVGTPAYMSPEQARGVRAELDERSDVYSVGAMLYHLLAGHAPYAVAEESTDWTSIVDRVIGGPPRALAGDGLPSELIAICEKAMERAPSARYETMKALAEDLRAYLEGRVVTAYERGAVAEIKKWVQRNKSLAASIVALVVVGICAAVVIYVQRDRAQREEVMRSHLASARLGMRSGAWKGALDSLATVRGSGAVDEVDIALDTAECHLGLLETAEATAVLDSIATVSSERGRWWILKAMLLPERVAQPNRARRHFERALELELEPEDAEFARGVLATDSPTALAHFENALRARPFHVGAFQRRLSTLLSLGRLAEADEQVRLARLYSTNDAYSAIATVLLRCGQGRFEEAREAIEAAVVARGGRARVPLESLVSRLESLAGLPADFSSLDAWFQSITEFWRTADVVEIPPLTPPCYAAKATLDIADFAVRPLPVWPWDSFGLPIFMMWPRASAELLEVGLLKHDDSAIRFAVGTALVNVPTSEALTQVDKFRRALPNFKIGMTQPSVVFGFHRLSRKLFVHCSHDLSQSDDAIRSRFLEWMAQVVVNEHDQWAEIQLISDAARVVGDLEVALAIVIDWIRVHPDDDVARTKLAELWSLTGAHDRGLSTVREVLARQPTNEYAKQVENACNASRAASFAQFEAGVSTK